MNRPTIAIATLGGTLSMQRGEPGEGITPSLGGAELLASVPELGALAHIRIKSLSLLPSASGNFDFLLQVLEWANDQITLGAQGVVITQGTDTLEESATFFEYLWPHDTPLVLTGAMRSASEASADGPGNLLDACRVALSASSKGRGVLVVMNGEIHASLSVRKTHTLALNAFTSATGGPVGLMIEHTPRFLHPGAPRMTLPIPSCTTHKVALLEASLSADTLILEQLVEMGYQGLVIAGFGAGHVSEKWSIALQAIAINLPVIVGSRTGAGTTAFHTYGFTGGEIDLIRKGLHLSGFLCPRKARLLLWLVIGCGQQSKLNDFLAYGQGCQTS